MSEYGISYTWIIQKRSLLSRLIPSIRPKWLDGCRERRIRGIPYLPWICITRNQERASKYLCEGVDYKDLYKLHRWFCINKYICIYNALRWECLQRLNLIESGYEGG